MKKLDTNNNVYTIVYAAIMVVIVALLLAVVSSALKPKQQANVELDRKKQVLSSLNIDIKQVKNVDDLYSQVISEQELNGKQVFVATIEDGSVKYIIPMHGAGLWGAIWGYMALNDDKNTIYGTFFNHDSETPGLGGEITTRDFQTRFNKKHILGDAGYAVEIVKGEAAGEQVQAISGATITSKGVETMINTTLEEYKEFLSDKPSEAVESEESITNNEEEAE
ncbi:MAG: FMN-binding protein [Paludibacteraceae bacterium]|nr:FMN-binding protein [Paludibacteraceae bacterium]